MMENKKLICVVCPNGCELDISMDENKDVSVSGEMCVRGIDWAKQEVINPLRTIASNILVKNGDWSLLSVRTDRPIPLKKISKTMEKIKKVVVNAPIYMGDIIIKNVANTNAMIIATRNVAEIFSVKK